MTNSTGVPAPLTIRVSIRPRRAGDPGDPNCRDYTFGNLREANAPENRKEKEDLIMKTQPYAILREASEGSMTPNRVARVTSVSTFFVNLLAIVLLAALPAAVSAQNLSFAGAQTTVVQPSGSLVPCGVALDAKGDLFIGDATNNQVVEVPAGGGAQISLGSGLDEPCGVALDGAGDVFIADSGNERVVELPWTGEGYGTQTTVASGLSLLDGIAVDAAGDVFMTEYFLAYSKIGNGPPPTPDFSTLVKADTITAPTSAIEGQVVEAPAGCVTSSCQITVASGTFHVNAVAVDGAGDLFIAVNNLAGVLEAPAGCTTSSCQITVGSGLTDPEGLTVDGAGDVFIADTLNSRVVEVPAGCVSSKCQTTVGSGLSLPTGVAVDGKGDVFIVDVNVGFVAEVQTVSVNFGNVNICAAGQTSPAPCSQTLTLNYNVTESGTIGTFESSGLNVLTAGKPNLDFNLASGGTCTGNVKAGSSCTVMVTFAPMLAGLRSGASQIVLGITGFNPVTEQPTSANVQTTTLIYGVGVGPQIAYGPSTQNTVGSGWATPEGLAVDGWGDVYVADSGNSRVVELIGSEQITLGSGLQSPYGVAVDGAGDLFIADKDLGSVVEVQPGCKTSSCQITVASGLNRPQGLALDGAGDVFIAETGGNRVVEVPAGGGALIQLGSGLAFPTGVAVDGAGDLLISDHDNSRIVELPAGGGAQIAVGISGYPTGISVDAAGDLFIPENNTKLGQTTCIVNGLPVPCETDNGQPPTGNVEEVPAGCTSSSCHTYLLRGVLFGINPPDPSAIAVDTAGDVFFSDDSGEQVLELQAAPLPSFSFASTAIGSTSVDSPQSFTMANIGNQPLNAIAPGLSIGANFGQAFGTSDLADCTSDFSLTPGEACNLSINFTPTMSGSIQSAAVFSDNLMNGNPAMQSVPLSGFGLVLQTISFTGLPTTVTYGAGPYTLNATATSLLPVTYSVTGPATISGSNLTITGAGSVTVTASQAGNAVYDAANPVSLTITVNPASQAITFTGLSATATYGAGPYVLNATATSLLPVSYSVTGPATVTGSTLTITGAGPVTVTASQAGNANYDAATPVTQSLTVNKALLTVTATSLTKAFKSDNPTLIYTIAGFVNGDTPAVVSGTPALSTKAVETSPIGTYPIAITAGTLSAVNYTFAFVNGTLTVATAETITFKALPNATYGVAPITLAATASSALPVSYSATGPVTLSGSTLKVTGAGIVTVVASQGGGSGYAAAVPVSRSFTVNPAPLTVKADNLSIVYGTPLPAFTGTVTGAVNGDTFVEEFTTTALASSPEGAYSIIPSVTGAGNYQETIKDGTLTIKQAGSVVTLTSSDPTAQIGQQITFTAVVESNVTSSPTQPTGTVAFYVGSTELGTATLTNGVCTLTTSFAAKGNDQVKADYLGDVNFTAGNSAAFKEVVSE